MKHDVAKGDTLDQLNKRLAVFRRRGFYPHGQLTRRYENGKVVEWIQHVARLDKGEADRFGITLGITDG